jgi:peptide/nickel transport system ATP-binding protein/oligopeptide transport system ATP-binding protein
MPAAPGLLLSVRNLIVQYGRARSRQPGVTAVRNVSLDIAPGRIQALVGESGSGKTSLARAILRLLPIEAGQIWFRGQDLAALDARELRQARRSIQAVFQDPLAALSPRRTVLQTLLEPLDHFRIGSPAERSERAIDALATVGLDARLRHRFPHELSGGQRQRVSLARALVSEPDLIIADEPLSSLDASVRARIIELLRELQGRLGLAFLFVSHDLSVVRQLADDVAVMYLGQLVETAPASRLFATPAHPYTRSLLASIPVPDPAHPRPIVMPGEPPSALTPPAGCVFHRRCPDRIDRCKTEAPDETCVSQTGPDHRVRCHLCKP